jgi:hypothetical protein
MGGVSGKEQTACACVCVALNFCLNLNDNPCCDAALDFCAYLSQPKHSGVSWCSTAVIMWSLLEYCVA